MSKATMTRTSKAIALVPLALLSGVWTASLTGVGSSATAASSADTPLPGGASVPTKAIEAPASVPTPGVIAPSVPDGTADSVVSSASTSGIPAPALSAYQRAAQIIDAADKSCNMPWELIAAIGRVESDHGRYGGNTLSAKGISEPGIYGPELNGRDGTEEIKDTDGGLLDHDKIFDRAVGPMQFIPSTWEVVKVDADGDGKRDPQDIDDASLATAVYLCSGTDNLSTRKGQQASVYRYNHSQAYVDLVLRIMAAYTEGDYTSVPSGTYAGTSFAPSYTTVTGPKRHQAKRHPKAGGKAGGTAGSGPSTSPTSSGSGTSTGSGSGTTGGGSGSTGSGGGLGGTGAGSGTPAPVTLPTVPPTSVPAPVQPVVKTLNQLGETTSYCANKLDGLGLTGANLDTAMSACATKVGDLTKTQADAVSVASIIAATNLCSLPLLNLLHLPGC